MVKPDKREGTNPDRVAELQQQLEDLKRRFPAHSLSPLLMQQLDELEEALRAALAQRKRMERENPPEGKA